MNNYLKKMYFVLVVAIMILGSTSIFAAATETTQKIKKEKPEMPKLENVIMGKITSIDATNVTIQVATINEINKPENFDKEKNKDEKKENKDEKKEKPNFDNFFTLTGETKTINIAEAEFGNKRPESKNSTDDKTTKSKKQSTEPKTYKDYEVGDYITIQATDNTYKKAKRVNQAMFGRMRGFKGDNDKKDNTNK